MSPVDVVARQDRNGRDGGQLRQDRCRTQRRVAAGKVVSIWIALPLVLGWIRLLRRELKSA